MALVNSSLYTGLIYLVIGPLVLLVLKFVSDSKFFKKGVTIKYSDSYGYGAERTQLMQDNSTLARISSVTARIPDKRYLFMTEKALYEEAVLNGNYELPAKGGSVLKANGLINPQDILKRDLKRGSYCGIAVLDDTQRRRTESLFWGLSRYNSLLLLAESIRAIKIVKVDTSSKVLN